MMYYTQQQNFNYSSARLVGACYLFILRQHKPILGYKKFTEVAIRFKFPYLL